MKTLMQHHMKTLIHSIMQMCRFNVIDPAPHLLVDQDLGSPRRPPAVQELGVLLVQLQAILVHRLQHDLLTQQHMHTT
jgi:hypothetical protein